MAGDSDEEEDQVVADAGVFNTLPAGADFLMCYCVAKGETGGGGGAVPWAQAGYPKPPAQTFSYSFDSAT